MVRKEFDDKSFFYAHAPRVLKSHQMSITLSVVKVSEQVASQPVITAVRHIDFFGEQREVMFCGRKPGRFTTVRLLMIIVEMPICVGRWFLFKWSLCFYCSSHVRTCRWCRAVLVVGHRCTINSNHLGAWEWVPLMMGILLPFGTMWRTICCLPCCCVILDGTGKTLRFIWTDYARHKGTQL